MRERERERGRRWYPKRTLIGPKSKIVIFHYCTYKKAVAV